MVQTSANKIKSDHSIPLPDNVFIDKDIYQANWDNLFVKYTEWMASCHKVTKIEEDYKGDPLDVEMFKTIKWKISDEYMSNNTMNNITWVYPPEVNTITQNNTNQLNNWYRLEIIHRFEFSSILQKMSVITSNEFDQNNAYTMFIKGSPEAILDLWDKSTCPDEYEIVYKRYTQKGLRVIALAYKNLTEFNLDNIEYIKREDYETN